MNKTILVQRLKKPFKTEAKGLLADLANALSFGGGLVNGGLSKEAMTLLCKCFRFDYMGASEFEWGAVPKAFNAMAKMAVAKQLEFWDLTVPKKSVRRTEYIRGGTRDYFNETDCKIFVLGNKDDKIEINKRILAMAQSGSGCYEVGPDIYLKESTNLANTICPVDEWDTDLCGWAELDNAFIFFTDKSVSSNVRQMFGI